MMPIKVFKDYVVCVETHPETDIGMRRHFVKECGWTEAQYRKIKDHAWFRVEVSIWKNGKQLAVEHLGCCCYETEEEFWTTYEGGYFADMVRTCAQTINDPELTAVVEPWHISFRKEQSS